MQIETRLLYPRFFEQYLSDLTKEENNSESEEISPLVKSLSGVLKLPGNFDYKKERTQFLEKKYK